MGIPEWKEGKKEAESLFKETVTENFPNLGKKHIQVYEAKRTSNYLNPKKTVSKTHCSKIIKSWWQIKNFEGRQGKKTVTYNGNHNRQSADFQQKLYKARRQWNHILKILKDNTENYLTYLKYLTYLEYWNCLPRILYPAKLSFIYKGEISFFFFLASVFSCKGNKSKNKQMELHQTKKFLHS